VLLREILKSGKKANIGELNNMANWQLHLISSSSGWHWLTRG
jgi:hypothetical protein